MKRISEQVIVITGASSGIGLATALEAAKRGARVCLVARDEGALRQVCGRIEASGGRAMFVAADVANKPAVERVAEETLARFGRIDTWVNVAGVSIVGKMVDIPEDEHRRVFETNFWGVVHGSLTAVRLLRKHGGAIINMGSVASDAAIGLQGMYSASKHAVKGFTDALRIELSADGVPISLTLIKPSAIDTPFPEHARNYTDHALQLPPPVYAPKEVAHAILTAAERPIRDVIVGGGGRFLSSLNHFLPRLADWFGRRALMPGQLLKQPPSQRQGSLTVPRRDGRTTGDHHGHVIQRSLYTRGVLRPRLTATLFSLAVGITAVALLGRGKS